MKKQTLRLLLAVAMVVAILPVTEWVEEISPIQDSGKGSAPAIEESAVNDS